MPPVTGKYIYGMISPARDSAAVAGIGDAALQTVTRGDFSAVVADAEMVAYKNMDRSFLAARLLQHQKVLEALMGMGCTVIPVKLGTIVRDDQEVGVIIDKSRSLVRNLWDKIKGTIEIDIVATWPDFPAVIKALGEDKEIMEYKAALLARATPITVEDQQQAGRLVMQALASRRAARARRILDALTPASQEVRVHADLHEQMVFNAAFLVQSHAQARFDADVESINAACNNELKFKYIGPLPCYSFYTLAVDQFSYAALDQARTALGLPATATNNEIKSAYKLKAAAVHPDTQPGMSATAQEFDELHKAYAMLLDYCGAGASGAPDVPCSFFEEAVQANSFHVTLQENP